MIQKLFCSWGRLYEEVFLVRFPAYFLILAVLACANPSVSFSASLLLDAAVREVLEDNVNPLLSGAAKPRTGADGKAMPAGGRLQGTGLLQTGSVGTGTGDRHTVLSAGGGASSCVGPEAEISIKAGIERQQFSKFTELDATSAGLYGALFKQFSDINAAQIGLSAVRSTYRFRALGGHGIRGSFDLRQTLSMKFWLNEGFEYERYDARSSAFSYNGRSAGLRAGYRFTSALSLVAAYTCLLRKFGTGMQTTVHSAAFTGAWRIVRGVDLTASFERQAYTSVPLQTQNRNNLSSLGIAVFY